MLRKRLSSGEALGLASTAEYTVSVASSRAKQIGTRWGLPPRSTVARRATLPSANRRLASSSVMWSLASGLLEQVDGLVDPVAMGAGTEDGEAQRVAVADGRAREEDPPAVVDGLQDARAIGVVEGDDRQLGFPRQLEVAGSLQAVVGVAGQVELFVERLLEGGHAVQ